MRTPGPRTELSHHQLSRIAELSRQLISEPPEPIGLEEYHQRRQALMGALPSPGVVVVRGAHPVMRSRDSEYPFRQNSDLHYLCGFPEPEALLVLLPEPPQPHAADGKGGTALSVLFCQDRSVELERWMGPRLGAGGARQLFGIDHAIENREREAALDHLLVGQERVYCIAGDKDLVTELEASRERLAFAGKASPQFHDLTSYLATQRMLKSPAEIALLEHAAKISALGHLRAMACVGPGWKEYQLQAEIEHVFRWHGAAAPAYESIVAGGANACVLHYIENDDVVQDGDLVLVDAGAEFALYAGDISRTFPASGRFSKPQRALYELVLHAQNRAIEAVRPGVSLEDIHRSVVRDLTAGLIRQGVLKGPLEARLADHGIAPYYPHATSHWLGLDVHDAGAYREDDGRSRLLEPGMVLTIEPGLYIHEKNISKDTDVTALREVFLGEQCGLGVRIEDDVVVTADGGRVISSDVPKQVDDIEAWMNTD